MIERLGDKPSILHPVSHKNQHHFGSSCIRKKIAVKRELTGVDFFIYSSDTAPSFVATITAKTFGDYTIKMITNRGVCVYPKAVAETFCIDQWRVRFRPKDKSCTLQGIIDLFSKLIKEGYDVIKTEHLYDFDDKPGYSSPKF